MIGVPATSVAEDGVLADFDFALRPWDDGCEAAPDSWLVALEIHRVRRILEPAATAMAAIRLGEHEFLELQRALRQMDRAPTIDAFSAADERFHATIVAGAGNSVLVALIQGLTPWLARTPTRATPDELAATQRRHRDIYDALLDADPEQARAAARLHCAEGERWLVRALGEQP